MGRDVISDAIMKDLQEAGLFEQEPNPTIPIKQPVRKPVPSPVKPMAPKPIMKPAVKRPVTKPVIKKPGIPSAPGIPAPVDPKMQKIQQQVFTIKNRLSKLALKTLIKKFLISHHDFDINVTKNVKDSSKIEAYASPFRGDCESLGGALDSMKIELEKLEKLIGEE